VPSNPTAPDEEEMTTSREPTQTLSERQCEPVKRFISVFEVDDPKSWIRENCHTAKQYFPRASCEHIGNLLAECVLARL